jgi:hypothetical protein
MSFALWDGLPAAPAWVRTLLGTDEQIWQIRQENHDAFFGADEPAATDKSPTKDVEAPAGDGSPAAPSSTQPRVPEQGRSDEGPIGAHLVEAVDRVIAAFGAATHFGWAVARRGSPDPAEGATEGLPFATLEDLRSRGRRGQETRAEQASVATWAPAVLAATLVIHASPLAETLRDRRRVAGRNATQGALRDPGL